MRTIGHFDPEILKEYENTSFEVKDEDGQLISFKIKEWDQFSILKKKIFSVITAANPMNETKSPRENKKNNSRLEKRLKDMNYVYYSTTDTSSKHAEMTFTIEDITIEEAVRLGREFLQYAILYCDKKSPCFIRCH